MKYGIQEIDGERHADTLKAFNAMVPDWPELQERHLKDGYWWLAYSAADLAAPVAFAGLVPLHPFPNVGYLKRCYVLPEHRGNGLQLRFLNLREVKATSLGWHLLASETAAGSVSSARTFVRAGYEQAFPEQPWGREGDVYWVKRLR